ncbi:MAG: AhpC/TSA family protein [Marinilabiliaceae bacterium]|nr:AhpC/TSA family protein [Marinilabiliaceae bacterium]
MNKRIFISLAMAVSIVALLARCAQPLPEKTTYHIKGIAPADKMSIFVVDKWQEPQFVDTILVTDGKFEYTGEAPTNRILALNYNGFTIDQFCCSFFNDGEPIEVDLNDYTIKKGSMLNLKYSEYLDRYRKLDSSFTPRPKEAQKMLLNGTPEDEVNAMYPEIAAQHDSVYAELDKLYVETVENNLDNILPVALASNYYNVKSVSEEKKAFFMSPERVYANHEEMEYFRKRIEPIENRKNIVGKPFTDLPMLTPNADSTKISDYCGKGKYVLIDVWASWCLPCRSGMPTVAKTLEKYKDKEFDVLSISIDRDLDAWRKAMTDLNMTWNCACDTTGYLLDSNLGKAYGMIGVPTYVLVDPEGKVVAIKTLKTICNEELPKVFGF